MNSLDKQMEDLIIRINAQEETIKAYRELTKDLKQTIKELRNDKQADKRASKRD